MKYVEHFFFVGEKEKHFPNILSKKGELETYIKPWNSENLLRFRWSFDYNVGQTEQIVHCTYVY